MPLSRVRVSGTPKAPSPPPSQCVCRCRRSLGQRPCWSLWSRTAGYNLADGPTSPPSPRHNAATPSLCRRGGCRKSGRTRQQHTLFGPPNPRTSLASWTRMPSTLEARLCTEPRHGRPTCACLSACQSRLCSVRTSSCWVFLVRKIFSLTKTRSFQIFGANFVCLLHMLHTKIGRTFVYFLIVFH